VIITNNSKPINLIKYWGCLQNFNEDASFESGGDAKLNVSGRNQLQLIGIDWNCLNLIHLIQRECVGDAPWTRGTIHMSHMIRHECVGDTPLSRGNVYLRTDIYGTSALVTDGGHEAPHI
jgi:hypothetical protein